MPQWYIDGIKECYWIMGAVFLCFGLPIILGFLIGAITGKPGKGGRA
mgnify:CR=1 FL=1